MSAPTPLGRPSHTSAKPAPVVGRPSASSSTSSSSGGNRGQSSVYFSDNKRSEVNELRTTLNTLEVQRDPKKYREACMKVIHYMTLGIDVSRLFTEMVMASATQDLVQKKLVYLYLCNYAESHSELTLLAINTLQKSCRDHNPMVRGMALRSMCALRVENLVEYVLQPLQDGLRDKSPYVRKTAVMGCVKLFYTSPSVVHECNIPDTLYSMLKDPDSLVVANCVVTLEEILASEGGIVLTQEIAHRLLTQLNQFNEWCQCIVMNILVRYVPSNEDEIYDILNILEGRLKHANSGVVLAATKLFLYLTRNMDDMHEDIYERLKQPLITQMTSGSSELCYTCLHHLELLLDRSPGLLEKEYQSFFCRYNEPNYVKFKKIEILTKLSAPSTVEAIVEEFAAYITDVDVEMARRSIVAVGNIAIKHEASCEHIMSMLMLFIDLDTSYVTAGTLVVLQNILRKYPHLAEEICPRIGSLAASVAKDDEEEARMALLWIIGAFGNDIEDAPYILEDIVENMEDETSHSVKLQLLNSAMKLFFLRPPETQKVLGALLEKCIDEELHMDVHDRALLYYRLLRTSVDEAKRVVTSSDIGVDEFAENLDARFDHVFDEFNSLSAIYGERSINFVEQRPPYNAVGVSRPQANMGEAEMISAGGGDVVTKSSSIGNLLDDDMFTSAPAQQSGSMLKPNATITPGDFEKIWVNNEVCLQIKEVLSKLPSTGEFEHMMGSASIKTLAVQPPQNGIIKFFHYAQAKTEDFLLVEIVVDVTTRFLTAKFKCENPENVGDFAVLFRAALAGNIEPLI